MTNKNYLAALEAKVLEDELMQHPLAYDLGDSIFTICRVDDGYDYRTFDYEGNDLGIMDGVYDNPDEAMLTAIKNILAAEGWNYNDAQFIGIIEDYDI